MPTGGAHPDEHLGSARKAWFKVHLAALHRHAGETLNPKTLNSKP
jgi:pyrroloquinoline quinone (PQQ) biosynthesis protein C